MRTEEQKEENDRKRCTGFEFHEAAKAVSAGPDKTKSSSEAMRKNMLGARHQIMPWPVCVRASSRALHVRLDRALASVSIECLAWSVHRVRRRFLYTGNVGSAPRCLTSATISPHRAETGRTAFSRPHERSISQCHGLLRMPRSRKAGLMSLYCHCAKAIAESLTMDGMSAVLQAVLHRSFVRSPLPLSPFHLKGVGNGHMWIHV